MNTPEKRSTPRPAGLIVLLSLGLASLLTLPFVLDAAIWQLNYAEDHESALIIFVCVILIPILMIVNAVFSYLVFPKHRILAFVLATWPLLLDLYFAYWIIDHLV